MKKVIKIVPYDPNWVNIFNEEAKRLKATLGPEFIDIHHVGSTAIVGMKAKPVIDIICIVKNPKSSIEKIEQCGYKCRGELNIPGRLFFNLKTPYDVNLHIYEKGNPEIDLNIIFRDYLISHPGIRDEYIKLKEQILEGDSKEFEITGDGIFTEYTLKKNDFIQKILKLVGFKGLRLSRVLHYKEREVYKNFLKADQIDKGSFILYEGVDIIAAAKIDVDNKEIVSIKGLTAKAEKSMRDKLVGYLK